MPFKSQAQRRWMYATHPEMAKKWSAHTPKGKKLPQHVEAFDLGDEAGRLEIERKPAPGGRFTSYGHMEGLGDGHGDAGPVWGEIPDQPHEVQAEQMGIGNDEIPSYTEGPRAPTRPPKMHEVFRRR